MFKRRKMRRLKQSEFIEIARVTIENSLKIGECSYWGGFYGEKDENPRCLLHEQTRSNGEQYIPRDKLKMVCKYSRYIQVCAINGKVDKPVNELNK